MKYLPAATMTPDKYVKMDGWVSHIAARCCKRRLFYRNWKHLSVSLEGWTHKRYGTKAAPQWLFGSFSPRYPDTPPTQMEIHLLSVPSWLVFLFYSHLSRPALLSRACLPAEALYLAARLSDSLSFFFPLWAPSSICGCHSQSPRWGSIPSRDLDTQPCQHHYINYLACFTLPSAMHNNTLIYDHNTYVRTPCTRQEKWIHSIKCKVGKEETNVYNLQCFSSFP